MGAPMKCSDCDARWYRMGSGMGFCPDCGSDEIDVDADQRRLKRDEQKVMQSALRRSVKVVAKGKPVTD